MNRRTLIALGAASATAGVWTALGGPAVRAQQVAVPPPPGEVPPPTGELTSFLVQISGLPEASQNIREMAIDELTIHPRLVGSRDLQVNMVKASDIDFGFARIVCVAPEGRSNGLREWFAESAKGKNIRKNISVTLFKSDKTPGRSYRLFGALPVGYSNVNFDASSTVQTETLTVKVGRVEFA
jgi:hypothetical protein